MSNHHLLSPGYGRESRAHSAPDIALTSPRGESCHLAFSHHSNARVRVYRSDSAESLDDDSTQGGRHGNGNHGDRCSHGCEEGQEGSVIHPSSVQHSLEESDLTDRTLCIVFVVFLAVGTALILSQFAL